MADSPDRSSALPDSPPPHRRRRRVRTIFTWSVRGVLVATIIAIIIMAFLITSMPGRSYRGPLPPLRADEQELATRLRRDVEHLAGTIGERNVYVYPKLAEAADWIETEFRAAGYDVERQTYDVARRSCANLIVEKRGTGSPGEILVVGAHYDTVPDCPGANDNGTGVAALLALARRMAEQPTLRTVRFVAFVNEEPPHFWNRTMGSLIYARRCRERNENIVGMLALETMGYYSDAAGSQQYPFPFNLLYPDTGDFIAFVGNLSCRAFVRDVVGTFRRHAQFPSEGGALPAFIPEAGWSDHWAFWQCGYPGLMVTDTAPFRYPHYHAPTDTPDQIDYERLARVVAGLEQTIVARARPAD